MDYSIEDLKCMTVVELKEILRASSQKISGTKIELIKEYLEKQLNFKRTSSEGL